MHGIARQLDALEVDEALDSAVDENLDFVAVFQEREQRFVAELEGD